MQRAPLGIQFLKDTSANEEAGDQSAKPTIIGQPALPPVPQPAFMTSASVDKAAS